LATIEDGTSNTIMFGEKHIRPNSLVNPANGNEHVNEDRSVFGSIANAWSRNLGVNLTNDGVQQVFTIVQSPTDQDSPLANARFGGPHSGVCQFAFVDGSVKALSNTLAAGSFSSGRPVPVPGVLHFLGVRNDGQVVPASAY
jgi:prepilin-type processing-associated H-X9-DG protein